MLPGDAPGVPGAVLVPDMPGVVVGGTELPEPMPVPGLFCVPPGVESVPGVVRRIARGNAKIPGVAHSTSKMR